LRAAPGFVDTNHGTVAFIVWTIAVGTPSEQQIEQFLNPYLQQTMDIVSFLSEQSHVKIFILQSVCNRVCNWFEFENAFNLDAFGLTMSIIRDSAGTKSFDYLAAIQDVVDNHTTSDLLKLSPNGIGDLPATLAGDTLGIARAGIRPECVS
jgi:hypothetical protein